MTREPGTNPIVRQASARRSELLQVVSEYLDKVGLINFSFRGAAKAAGISPTSLIRNFTNRDTLLDALLEHAMQAMFSRIEKESSTDPRSDVIQYYRDLVADWQSILYDRNWTGPWHQLAVLSESPKAPTAMRARWLRAWQVGLTNDVEVLRANGVPAALASSIGRTFYSCKRGIHRDYCLHENRAAARRDYECLVAWLESSLKSTRRAQ